MNKFVLKKFEIRGMDGTSWIQCGETEDRKSIQVVITEAPPAEHGRSAKRIVTGIIHLSKWQWSALCNLNYKLDVDEIPEASDES